MTQEHPLLKDLLIILLASIPIAFACNRLRLPVLVGFMLTGVVIGPSGTGFIQDVEDIESLAEIGVILLLFALGLEFSMRHILELKRMVFFGGGLQVLSAISAALGALHLAGRTVQQSLFFGFVFALSSTAIVLKSYSDRAEVDTPHGRTGVALLLFQDLCVVPMMLAIPMMSGKEGASAGNIVLKVGLAVLAVAVILVAARFLVPLVLHRIVELRSREVFLLFVVLACLGTSWLTASFGLSLALGAFIAGLVLSESEYSHQIVADILPFRDVFNSIFFISIGMLLSLSFLLSRIPTVLLLVTVVILGKTLLVFLLMLTMNRGVRVSIMIGLALAQVGEFSFILAKAGLAESLISMEEYQLFLATSILTMLATPFLIQSAPEIGFALQSWIPGQGKVAPDDGGTFAKVRPLDGHTIVVGYGLNGRNLSRVLRSAEIPYLILELNADTVHRAAREGEPILFGDATRGEVLSQAGLKSARILVLAISDPAATRRTIALARSRNPGIHIIVRTRYVSEVTGLYSLGADQVIPEEFETSIELFARVLAEYGIAGATIKREVEEIRSKGYRFLRAPSPLPKEENELASVLSAASTATLVVREGYFALGRTLADLNVRKITGASVVAVIRQGKALINPEPSFRFAAGDILVLLGSPSQTEIAERLIEQGGSRPKSLSSAFE